MKRLIIGTSLCLTTTVVQANDTSSYFQAKSGIASGEDISSYTHLSNHPLYPDLAATFYRKNLDRDSEIIPLFAKYYALRPIKQLHNRWIEKKYNEGNYQSLVANYYSTGNEEAECAYRAAQLSLGNREVALENIYWTWMSDNSVSPICDPVFQAWEGSTNPKHRLARAKKTYLAGHADFAIALANRLPFNDIKHTTMLRFAEYLKNPETMTSLMPQQLTDSALAKELLPTALKKLIRINSSRYAPFAMQFANILGDEDNYQDMLSKLTEYLVNRDDPQIRTSYNLLSKPSKNSTESIISYLVGQRDWQSIRQLVKADSNNSMALYWLGRALDAAGESGKSAYEKAAKTRSYYGFLAADKIGVPYQFNEDITRPNSRTQLDLNDNSSLARALLLAQYGDSNEARLEIVRIAKLMDPAQKRQLAYWLHQNRFYFETIYVLGKAKDWNDINIRFPTPFNPAVENASMITGTEPTWVYAIMRQESSMNANAKSSAKAKGLMQLIPGTARRMANQQGLSLSGDGINDPMINTQLGAAYLAKMFYRYNNMALASAAYNAGPGRVDKWMLRDIDDMAIWVEKIPFNETRKYVKNIMEYQQVYAKHLGVTIPTITERLEGRYQAVK